MSGTVAWADGTRSVDALLDIAGSPKPIPYVDRQAAKNELIKRPYDQVLPKLAVCISHAPVGWSSRILLSGTGKGLGDEQSPPGEQAIWAFEQVWTAHTYGPEPPSFAHDLVTYWSDPALHDLRNRLIPEMSIYWCDEAEAPIARLFADGHESPHLRYDAAYALIKHARDKYVDALLDFAEAHPGRDEEFFINNLMPVGFPHYGDPPADSRLLKVADDIMETDIHDTGHLSNGYGMALSMGELIATRGVPPDARNLPNPFAADQDAPGNRRPDGNLTEKFFETPVIRARAWWDQHGQAVRVAATRPAERGP